MNAEEAKTLIEECGLNITEPTESKVLAVVIESLDKQIPKRFELWNGQCSCPNCKKLFGSNEQRKRLVYWEMPYCKYCGQKLDWGDSNE